MTENQRLKIIRKEKKLTQLELAESLGVKQNTISTIEKDGNTITDNIKMLLKSLYDVNINWLETGIGEMFHFNDSKNLQIEIPTKNKDGVPFYDLDVTATITGSYLDFGEKPEYFVDIPPFNDCDAYVRVYGDSMYPKYQSGDIIALKKINNLEFMRWGHAHLVVSDSYYDDLRTVKEIHPCDDDDSCIVLKSSNPSYKGNNKVKIKHILGLFLVKGKVRQDYM